MIARLMLSDGSVATSRDIGPLDFLHWTPSAPARPGLSFMSAVRVALQVSRRAAGSAPSGASFAKNENPARGRVRGRGLGNPHARGWRAPLGETHGGRQRFLTL